MTIPVESTSTHRIWVGFLVMSVTHNHPLQTLLSSAMVLFSLVVWVTLPLAPGPVSSSKSFKSQYYLRWLIAPFCCISFLLMPNISLPCKSSVPSSTVCSPLLNSSPALPSAANLQPSFKVFNNCIVSSWQWCCLALQIVSSVLGSLNTKQHSLLTFKANILSSTSMCL